MIPLAQHRSWMRFRDCVESQLDIRCQSGKLSDGSEMSTLEVFGCEEAVTSELYALGSV
jgi:hypothetical protein